MPLLSHNFCNFGRSLYYTKIVYKYIINLRRLWKIKFRSLLIRFIVKAWKRQ